MSEITDFSKRFLFEQADIRGEKVTLKQAFKQLTAGHDYSDTVKALIGQFAAAVVLISNNLKYSGKIILQAQSAGPISLLMVECTSDSTIRGIVRGEVKTDNSNPWMLLKEGQLAITIERENGPRYQGIIALDTDSLATALDDYFLQSEQLNTRFWLAASGECAAGLMLQQLPAQLNQDASARDEQWQHAVVLAETIEASDLLTLSPDTLLYRLYHQDPIRLFPPIPVAFHCPCNRERSQNALQLLPSAELEEMLNVDGHIDMNCDICGQAYRFLRSDFTELADPRILH
jgi:molecular chaperone Hsp33